jgi:acetoin utilization deacetylase AcuC-like enzyme
MATGFVFSELYLWHDTGNWPLYLPPGLALQPGEHAENPETKRRFRNLLDVSGLLEQLSPIKPRAATEDEIARFHTREHIASIKAKSAQFLDDAGVGTPMGRGSFEIACLSAGGAMAAVDAVIAGRVKNAYALTRPPGHHATRTTAMGFCIFGNVAIAILHAIAVHGLKRVATFDWDVHHGNGTQSAFYGRRDVLTVSIHQDGCFPADSGHLRERGEGEGLGYNINIPLPAGAGDGAYLAALERAVIPAFERFKPELIVIPSGLDASAFDPLGRMCVTSDGYRRMTRLLMDAAGRLCGGRLVMSHEGGYSAAYVPNCGLAVLEEMSGVATGVKDEFLDYIAAWPAQKLAAEQAAVIDKAEAFVAEIG